MFISTMAFSGLLHLSEQTRRPLAALFLLAVDVLTLELAPRLGCLTRLSMTGTFLASEVARLPFQWHINPGIH
jgi:hypothetical protein